MSLRLLEVVLPTEDLRELQRFLVGWKVLGSWTEELANGQALGRILLRTEQTETFSDLLSGRFGGREGFRLMLFAVEATTPRAQEEIAPEISGPAGEVPASEPRSARRIGREELYTDVAAGADLSPVYVVTVALSALVAAVGLIRGSVSVVVGAMVIAPLLGPNVALALATTLGDVALAWRSFKTIIVGIGAAGLLSFSAGFVMHVDPTAAEVASRTEVDIGDLVLALAAGSAGTLTYTSGVPAALVGVMVAVALLPPLVTAGLLAGAGYLSLAFGALLLVVSNVACVNLAGVVTFLAQRVRPRTWWEAEKAKRATRLAVCWWIVLIGILLVIILHQWD